MPRNKAPKNGPVKSIRPGRELRQELDARGVDWLSVILFDAENALICNSREHRIALLKALRRK